jgi:hypothetical protein
MLRCLLALISTLPLLFAQESTGPHPPPYRGVATRVDGVFVTPVPGVPLSAVVKLESTQLLPDGTSTTRKTSNVIARDSQGRIYNERRQLLPASFNGTTPVLGGHIFDPQTRLSTFLDPRTHLARQTIVAERPPTAPPPAALLNTPNFKQEDLGVDTIENVAVHGMRQTRTLPAASTGAGKDIIVTDEYWYSDELHLNMLTKHSDPRTGVQIVTIAQVNRSEPDAALFQVPIGYKIVDENPPN